MTTQEAAELEIDRSGIGRLELDEFEVPYVHLGDEPFVQSRLRVGETEYAYHQSFPVKGHSAVMPGAVRDLLADEKQVLVAERQERYIVYLA